MKKKIIDEIVKRHPSYGTQKQWSTYTGGMKDSGYWYYRKMMDAPLKELRAFLFNIIAEENSPKEEYSQDEIKDMNILHKTPNGFITEYTKKKMEEFNKIQENFLLGIS